MGIRHTYRTLAGSLVALAGVAALAVPAASAAADPADLVISSGSLSSPTVAVGNFGAITLNGAAQTSNATMDAFSVTDGRGTGGGWNVTVQATRFAEYDAAANAGVGAYVVSGKMLPTSSLTMAAPTVAANGTTSAAPAITTGPYTLDGAGAVKIAGAAIDTGMGTYNFTTGTSKLTLSVPSSAYAKTYRSDLTVSVVAGP